MSAVVAPVGLITGTGLYELPGLDGRRTVAVDTPHGSVEVQCGRLDGVEVAHLARHGRGHARLSHQVDARAGITALRRLGVGSIISTTVCGATDPDLELGRLVVFDDLHFPSNRLPDGGLCTLFGGDAPAGRGHWVYERALPAHLGGLLAQAARATGHPVRHGGTYGHVDGPRFNTRSEIAALVACGVVAVSQTAGPEVVLAGEAGLPHALVGFITDHANGVSPEPTPPEVVATMFGSSAAVLQAVLRRVVPLAAADPGPPAGSILPL